MMRAFVTAVLLLIFIPAAAHELRPAYLELHEGKSGEFRVLWKTPMRGDMRLALTPEFSGRTENTAPVTSLQSGDAAIQTWRVRALEPLRGQSLRIAGLEGTMTDALVRVEFADGTQWVKRLTATEPSATIPERPGAWLVAAEYLKLGVEHILHGVDHLLFVLALLFLARSWPRLVATVTAFTVAHSLTLAAATLGWIHVPQKPVEAAIALSIVFVAADILRAGADSLTQRAPWIVAFAFGLLHGLGFAGALRETGVPEHAVPVALLFFNLGVEAGQLFFIAAVFLLFWLMKTWRVRSSLRADHHTWHVAAAISTPVAYAIGALAAFWVFERTAAFWS